MTASADAPASIAGSRRAARVRWAAALSGLVIGMNLTVMNVAIADVRSSFPSASFSLIGWVVTAYTIVLGAVLVPAGRLADLLGRRSVFLFGLGTFAAGSVVAGTAPALWILIAGRGVQGLGAACVMPASMALLFDVTPVPQRPAAMSFYGGVSAVGAAGGPSIGALLIDATSWRVAFFLGLPLVAATYALARDSLPRSRPIRGAVLPDLVGSLLLMASMTALTFAIVEGPRWGWGHPGVAGSLAGSLALIPVFVRRCNRHRSPVMAISLFRHRSFAAANVAGLLFGIAVAGTGLVNVLFLRDVWGYSLVAAGFGALPTSVAAMLAARPVGRLGVRYGERALGIPGALCIIAALVWFRVFADEGGNYWFGYVPGVTIVGLGIAASFPMIATAVVRDTPPAEFSLASATNRTFIQIGNAIGVAVPVGVLSRSAAIGSFADFRLAWVLLAGLGGGCAVAVAVMGSSPRP